MFVCVLWSRLQALAHTAYCLTTIGRYVKFSSHWHGENALFRQSSFFTFFIFHFWYCSEFQLQKQTWMQVDSGKQWFAFCMHSFLLHVWIAKSTWYWMPVLDGGVDVLDDGVVVSCSERCCGLPLVPVFVGAWSDTSACRGPGCCCYFAAAPFVCWTTPILNSEMCRKQWIQILLMAAVHFVSP